MSKTWGFFFGGSGHGPESSCQISAYYKFFPCLHVFCRISTGLLRNCIESFCYALINLIVSAEQIRTGKKSRLRSSLVNKRLRTSESKGTYYCRVATHGLKPN